MTERTLNEKGNNVERGGALGVEGAGSNPQSDTKQLCVLGQITYSSGP